MKVSTPRARDPLTVWLIGLAVLVSLLIVVAGLAASAVPIPTV